jgi:hypothetical protein
MKIKYALAVLMIRRRLGRVMWHMRCYTIEEKLLLDLWEKAEVTTKIQLNADIEMSNVETI